MSRDVGAEALGTFLLLYVIVGSGIAAETLSLDSRVQLFAHAVVVGVGLGALIAMLQTVSVTVARALTDTYTGIAPASIPGFLVAQIIAGLLAAAVAISFYPKHAHQQVRT